ncbi:MAG TPA: SIMPL domain-containing protein [Geminicoccaceae bacterium]|nr:SIMPL domain-containing protein [Geminicoccaceae bacterium]
MANTSEVPHHRTPAWAFLAGAIILGLGLAGAGFLTGRGFERGRSADRYVTVKGLAESFVTADLAVWPLRIIATGDDLARVQEQIDRDLATVTAFLTEQEIEPEAIQPQRVEVTDLLAQSYRPEGIGDNRFIVAQTIIVRTEQVERVARVNRQTGELVKRGVVLADTGGPTYLFTRLNEIKPEMLAAATRNARLSAEQFAADSGSAIAEIRRASQGLFEILPRDPAPGLMEANQVDKKIRVVSTVEYRLGR